MSDIADLGFTEEAFKSSRNFLNEHQKCHRHTEAVSECYLCNWRYFRDHVTHAISRAESELKDSRVTLGKLAEEFHDAINASEARMAELEAEKQKSAQEWLHLEAANRLLIQENKRLRKCADEMADRLEDAYSQMAGGCECYNWTEMKRAAGSYRAGFPREEAKHG